MKIKILLIASLLLFLSIYAFAQTEISPWLPDSPEEFEGVYHFGDSEMEVDLVLIYADGKYYAQIRSGNWDNKNKGWMLNFETLNNVKIEGNKFYSDKSNGELIAYDDGTVKGKGLLVNDSWTGSTGRQVDGYDFGFLVAPKSFYFAGKYDLASLKLLTLEDLKGMTHTEIEIMRNDIYARYRYIFKDNREMKIYFNKQKWYDEQHENVDAFLTDLEIENIKLIKRFIEQGEDR